jgi:hypothetical protein
VKKAAPAHDGPAAQTFDSLKRNLPPASPGPALSRTGARALRLSQTRQNSLEKQKTDQQKMKGQQLFLQRQASSSARSLAAQGIQ